MLFWFQLAAAALWVGLAFGRSNKSTWRMACLLIAGFLIKDAFIGR